MQTFLPFISHDEQGRNVKSCFCEVFLTRNISADCLCSKGSLQAPAAIHVRVQGQHFLVLFDIQSGSKGAGEAIDIHLSRQPDRDC